MFEPSKNSINKYYQTLVDDGCIISNIAHISNNSWPSVLDKFNNLNKEDYDCDCSLLYKGETPEFLVYKNGIPKLIAKYKVIFAVGYHTEYMGYHTEYNGTDIPCAPKKEGRGACLGYCEFFENFFKYHPSEISTTECHGNKCRRDFSVTETGVWCESCHGDFNGSALNLDQIMYKEISVRSIPEDLIVYISKKVEPIENNKVILTKVIELMQKEKQDINYLNKTIEDTDEAIKRLIASRLAEKKKAEEKLEQVLAVRGKSITAFNDTLVQIFMKVKALEDEEKEKALKTQLLEIEMQKKSAALDFELKMAELDAKANSIAK
ncbi:hypothetical protein QJ857_gp0560 [Tupanvirus soda lake]|uniref:Uncharacterized protein n=2 Tax=Tupanvirus TaxID=2094720 RepID=A0A6N1NW32_9VIRU|nr:hypothetical protein QJ857_gp0560 [Tupanvirus soda lake]QKU35483.1 hypothetical protein [Tupanvirus soda lake]